MESDSKSYGQAELAIRDASKVVIMRTTHVIRPRKEGLRVKI